MRENFWKTEFAKIAKEVIKKEGKSSPCKKYQIEKACFDGNMLFLVRWG